MMYHGYNPVDYLTVIQNPTSSLTQSWDRPLSLERCRTVTGANHWERVDHRPLCGFDLENKHNIFDIWACFTLAFGMLNNSVKFLLSDLCTCL